MKFTYCPDCGTKLIQKEIGDEGLMPYCENCKKPFFEMFSTCIIALWSMNTGRRPFSGRDTSPINTITWFPAI